MPISPIVLQRRHAELGRIRLGQKGAKGQPQKLDRFRFTSVSEQYIRDLATLYGGEPKPWDNSGIASWEVYSEAKSIPVIVVKGGLSQWMEFWSGGGCIHRCDGEHNILTDSPCDLEEKVKQRVRGQDVWVNPHSEAKPTTRLSMMLVELEAIGVWRCETHGWNAAAEIPAVAELAQFVGDLVPANLHLVERRSVKDGQTSRFVVPVLDLQIGTERLKEIVAQKSGQAPPAELGGGSAPAIESAKGPDPYAEYMGRLEEAASVEDLRDIWRDAVAEHLVGTSSQASPARTAFFTAYEAKGEQFKTTTPPASQAQPNEDGSYDAVVVEDDADAVWQEILKAGHDLHGWKLAEVQDDFAERMQGMIPSDATAGELRVYLEKLSADEPEPVSA